MARLAHETVPPTLINNYFTLRPASGGWGTIAEKSKNSQRHQGKCYAGNLCNIAASGIVEGLNNKAKVTMRKAYGFRTFKMLELSLYHVLGKLPEPKLTHSFY